jgi:hypothetical protein
MDTNQYIPISEINLLQSGLEGMLSAGNDLLVSLEKAKPKPYVLDDATINNIRRVYTDQRCELKKYQALLVQWQSESTAKHHLDKFKSFNAAIQAVSSVHKKVFFLIDFFKEHTIDKILAKDDETLATDLLAGNIYPPYPLDMQGENNKTVIPSKFIPCEKCHNLVAHLIFAEDSTVNTMKRQARIMQPIIEDKHVDTWVVGEPIEIRGNDALAYTMKVWPQQEEPLKMFSSDFNQILVALEKNHC